MALPAKNWVSRNDKPREKLDREPSELTDVELIAVLLGTGSKNDNVLELAGKLLKSADNNLTQLARRPLYNLMSLHGIGIAKGSRFKAAMEIARRMQFDVVPRGFKVKTSQDAFKILGPNLGSELYTEEFWAIFLNKRCKLIEKTMISRGGLSSTVADPRVIFGRALDAKASSIIVAHNHPSGSLEASQADINLTKKLKAGGELLDIQLIDHLIISGNNYCSFADSGLL